MAKKLWNDSGNSVQNIDSFTIGNDAILDRRIAAYDIKGSMAHVNMLSKMGWIIEVERNKINNELESILKDVESNEFKIQDGVEDVHSQLEFMLTERLGDLGKKIHIGRSRNDQVALDLRLYYKDVVSHFKNSIEGLTHLFLQKSEESKDILMPGYTHSQVGMVSSFGMWYASFAEGLIDDLALLNSVHIAVDKNPLGTAAGYGTSIPLDREMTTRELGFNEVLVNPIYAQSARGKIEFLLAQFISNVCLTLNRFASDICIYCNENYGFLKLDDSLITGSSIMPHKKNPDVLELVRAHTRELILVPQRIASIISNLQSGYHRDFQLLKGITFEAIDRFKMLIEMTGEVLRGVNEYENIINDPKYNYAYTVEAINNLVRNGKSFRDAYFQIKEEVNDGTFDRQEIELSHKNIGSIGNLGLEILKERLEKL